MEKELKKPEKTSVSLSRTLRKNMTTEERRLWYDFLKTYPIRFKRQKAIGHYIVDFYCADANLVIELDGHQHYTKEGRTNDAIRTQHLKKCGLHVIRFKNYEIWDHFPKVCEKIDILVKTYLEEGYEK